MNIYSIRFSGLKEGVHQFNFEIGDTFFEQLDYSEIKKATLHVKADFEKKSTMLMLNFEISGDVEVMCDKCTDDFRLQIKGEEELIYKFGEGESNDEKVIIIPENEIEIDLIQPIYEAKSMELNKYECLVRMMGEDGEIISPFLVLDIDGGLAGPK